MRVEDVPAIYAASERGERAVTIANPPSAFSAERMDVVTAIEAIGSPSGTPSKTVVIASSSPYHQGREAEAEAAALKGEMAAG